MSVTRIFRRRALRSDGAASLDAPRSWLEERMPRQNEATAIFENPLLEADATDDVGFDARRLFVARYPIIRKALECHRKRGALILAFDDHKVALGQAWLAASLDRTRAAIFGRHSMCNVAVPPDHDRVSLRHLAILVRALSHTEVRIRVLDLHTKAGFKDESGRVLQAVASEGSMFLRVGGVTLVILVTDESSPVADDPEDQYACLPERIFLEEREGTAGEPEPRRLVIASSAQSAATVVRSKLGPVAAVGALLSEDERPFGTLTIRTSGGSARKPIGPSIVERGLLVGRYARCDVGMAVDEDSRLSRVHLLVVREGDQVIAVDTASVNGTLVGERSILVEPLTDGLVLDLGGEMTLSWHGEAHD